MDTTFDWALIQLTIAFAVLCTIGGLACGFKMSDREPQRNFAGVVFQMCGAAVLGITVMLLVVSPLSMAGFEALGVSLGVSLFLFFMAVGMSVNPYKKSQ